eukprot:g6780.t1
MTNQGFDGRRWAPLDIEDVALNPRMDFESLGRKPRTSRRRLSPIFVLLVFIILLSLTITFLALYLTERNNHGTKWNSNGAENRLLLSETGYRPFEKFQVDVDYRGVSRKQESKEAMVSSNLGDCSDLSKSILDRGGNAVDAAVTGALCLGLMIPAASGIGGGTFILVRMANGDSKVIDAREQAPLASSVNMFKNRGAIAARIGAYATGVPLEAKGLEMMWKNYGSGKLTWADLVNPVIPLAEKGFKANPYFLAGLTFRPRPTMMMVFNEMRNAFMINDSSIWRLPNLNEQCCKRPALAKTLKLLSEKGAEELYKSSWGDDLVNDIQNHVFPGIITKDDLVQFHPRMHDPIKAEVFGMEVLTVPPPSSGVAMIAALKLLDTYNDSTSSNAPVSHRLVSGLFRSKSNLGDPGENGEFLDLDSLLKDVITDEFANELKKATKDNETSKDPNVYGGKFGLNSEVVLDFGTSHLCIVDHEGNAVSMTTSINSAYGSYVISPKTGVLLNNHMSDFSKPKMLTKSGNEIPASQNTILPGRKPLSSMSPTMFLKDGKLKMVIGSSGGPTIITSILQVVFHRFKQNFSLERAMYEPRLHNSLTGMTYYEDAKLGDYYFHTTDDVLKELESRGHNISKFPLRSHVTAIEILENGIRVGIADPRKDGAPCTP